MIKFLLLSLFGFLTVKSEYCNFGGLVHEIRSQNDLQSISNCTTFNGSLFINGEYNINNLSVLSNLEIITGYLLIWNSHNLTNLMGLNNLEHINGNNLYLNNYFVYIIDNHNLCFVNTIDWTTFNSVDNYRTALNGIGCASCHSLCNGCWNSELCQNCLFYKSGNTCVEQCPLGTDIEGSTCIEFIPFPPENLEINTLNYTIKNITWDPPSFPNGVILGYNFYVDQYLVYTGLNTNYLLSNLNLNQNYNLKVNVFNSEGNSDNSSIILSIGDGFPEIPNNISYTTEDQSLHFNWLSDGTQYYYQVLNHENNYTSSNQLILNNLNYYSNYSIRIKAYSIYGESNYSDWFNFISYEYNPKTPNPIDLTLNNLSLNIKFNPNYPLNGRILNYNFRVFQNSNLFLNQSTNLDNINISTNYYKDYEVDYNLTNSVGISNYSNKSYITTPIGHPIKPNIPILDYNTYLTIIIDHELDTNGLIILYEILMYNQSNYTVIYNNQNPGNVTLYEINKNIIYEFQSKVYTSPTLFSVSENISYNPQLQREINNYLPWWTILIIVIACIILIILIMSFTSYCFNKNLNKVGDSVVVNNNRNRNNDVNRINPAYEPNIDRLPELYPYNHLNIPSNNVRTNLNYNSLRRRSDSNYYSEVERETINNPNYESLFTPSNPPDISVPKNMLKS
jgi:hypothetical protein